MQNTTTENFNLGNSLVDIEESAAKQAKEVDRAIEMIVPQNEAQEERLAIQEESRKAEEQANKNPYGIYTFPDVMSGAAKHFTERYALHLEVPPQFLFTAYLTCLGSVLAGRVSLDSEIEVQTRLYCLLLGQSADDRKSTAIQKTASFFKSADENFKLSWGVGSAEGVQKFLEESSQLVLAFDEFKHFVSKAAIQGSTLLSCVNSLFEMTCFENRTKNSYVKIDEGYLSFLAASTVDTYEEVWESKFTNIGFDNRLWLVHGRGERKFSIPKKLPERDMQLFRTELGAILRHVGGGLELPICPNAFNLYDDWYMSRQQSIYMKRLDVYAPRFMTLLAVNDLKTEIDVDVVERVLKLCDWQYEVRQLLAPIDADGAVAAMEERIRRQLRTHGPRTRRELIQFTNAQRTGLWTFNSAIENLKKGQEIWENKKRSPRVFCLIDEGV